MKRARYSSGRKISQPVCGLRPNSAGSTLAYLFRGLAFIHIPSGVLADRRYWTFYARGFDRCRYQHGPLWLLPVAATDPTLVKFPHLSGGLQKNVGKRVQNVGPVHNGGLLETVALTEVRPGPWRAGERQSGRWRRVPSLELCRDWHFSTACTQRIWATIPMIGAASYARQLLPELGLPCRHVLLVAGPSPRNPEANQRLELMVFDETAPL